MEMYDIPCHLTSTLFFIKVLPRPVKLEDRPYFMKYSVLVRRKPQDKIIKTIHPTSPLYLVINVAITRKIIFILSFIMLKIVKYRNETV
jgi:hypothetical protein